MAHSEHTSRRPLEGTGGAVPVLLRMIPAGEAFSLSYHFHPWGAVDRGKMDKSGACHHVFLPPITHSSDSHSKQNLDFWG